MSEITYEYIRAYLYSMEENNNEGVKAMNSYAKDNKIPIIKFEVKSFLEFFLAFSKPKKILEIGTAIGYSAIVISESLKDQVEITTIEKNKAMIEVARKNFRKYDKTNIKVVEGDANDVLKELNKDQYDMIFMDAAKGQYMSFLPYCIDLLKEGGVLITDNVLQDGFIAKSRWSVPRRQRTIHKRMRQYLGAIKKHPQLKTTILPIADGMALSYKSNTNKCNIKK